MVNEQKALTLLGFASKARKLSFGMDGSVYSIRNGAAFAAVYAADVSDKSKKEVRFFCSKNNTPVVQLGVDIETLSRAVGKKAGILAVNDKGFAESLCRIYEGGNAND